MTDRRRLTLGGAAALAAAMCGGAFLRGANAPPESATLGPARSSDLARRFAGRGVSAAQPLVTDLSDPLIRDTHESFFGPPPDWDAHPGGFRMICDLDVDDTRVLGPGRHDARFTPDSQVVSREVRWSVDSIDVLVDRTPFTAGRGTLILPAPYDVRVQVEWDDVSRCIGTVEGLHALQGTIRGDVEGAEVGLIGCGFNGGGLAEDGSFFREVPAGTECQLAVTVLNGYAVAVSAPVDVVVDGDVVVELTAPRPPPYEAIPLSWYLARAYEQAERFAEIAGLMREAAELTGDTDLEVIADELEAEEQATREYIDRLERGDTDAS